jgi:hypothetical protein
MFQVFDPKQVDTIIVLSNRDLMPSAMEDFLTRYRTFVNPDFLYVGVNLAAQKSGWVVSQKFVNDYLISQKGQNCVFSLILLFNFISTKAGLGRGRVQLTASKRQERATVRVQRAASEASFIHHYCSIIEHCSMNSR